MMILIEDCEGGGCVVVSHEKEGECFVQNIDHMN